MNVRKIVLWATWALFAGVGAGWSEEPAKKTEDPRTQKARQVLELSGAAGQGLQMMEAMLPALQQLAPQVPEAFWKEFMAEVRPEELVDRIVPVYAQHFEEADLDQLIAFYSSPIGRKTVERLPAITAESMAIGQAWGMEIAKRAMDKLTAAGLQPNPKSSG